MKKRKLALLGSVGLTMLTLLVCVLLVSFARSQKFDDFILLNQRRDPNDIAIAFTTALRLNHPIAYEITDPELWPRLDEWMETHEAKNCKRRGGDILGGGRTVRFVVDFECYLEDGGLYSIIVKDIVIKDSTVIDWGEIIENTDERSK